MSTTQDQSALWRCRECDDDGRLPDGDRCDHRSVYRESARRGAAAARAVLQARRQPEPEAASVGVPLPEVAPW